jgi:hypothetical protein
MSSHNHFLTVDWPRKAKTQQGATSLAKSGVQTVAAMPSHAVLDETSYTVTLSRILNDDSLEHHCVLTTPNAWEAVQRRNELNAGKPFFGSKEAAQVIRRESMPRRWKLLAQVSASEVHLRCEWSHARALLRSPNAKLLKRLLRGNAVSQTSAVYLQSEQVELTLEFYSNQSVKFTKTGCALATRQIKVCTPVVGYFDVNKDSQFTVDTRRGAVAHYSFHHDTLLLPEVLAKALWQEGVVLPLRQESGRINVRMMDPELRTRLELSRLKISWFDNLFRSTATYKKRTNNII